VIAGLLAGCPQRKLEVLSALTEEDAPRLTQLLDEIPVTISEIGSKYPFEILITAKADAHVATVHLVNRHTQVAAVLYDGEDLTEHYRQTDCAEAPFTADRHMLNVETIVAFADEVPLDRLRPLLLKQIEMNMAIAEEGVTNHWGACIGKLLYKDGSASVKDRARALAAAGSDARMSGCEMPVCILSGSGNQGITATVPVVVYARDMGASEEMLLRALIVSDLVTIHQKTGIGTLSAYCGAISAGCGCGTGICYLNGGRYTEISHTLDNSIAILSGTICDGAKASCAAKIAMAVEAGIMGYEMCVAGHDFVGGDGIVDRGVEATVRNVGRLARDGMSETDREIIRIMLNE
jgi:L-cysteine desulfidase